MTILYYGDKEEADVDPRLEGGWIFEEGPQLVTRDGQEIVC